MIMSLCWGLILESTNNSEPSKMPAPVNTDKVSGGSCPADGSPSQYCGVHASVCGRIATAMLTAGSWY